MTLVQVKCELNFMLHDLLPENTVVLSFCSTVTFSKVFFAFQLVPQNLLHVCMTIAKA
jgi:hypothetical protein